MRFILVLAFIGIFLVVGFTALKTSPDEDTPVKYAKQFCVRLQAGDFKGAVSNFGGNICRCPADLGWVSYLIYASDEEPNLAFMMGRRFVRGDVSYKKMKSAVAQEKQTLLERPEDYEVDVPVSFDPAVYAPYFLPLDTAYGLPISSTDLETFLADPDRDAWKSLTMRLRPSLEAGTVATPEDARAQIDSYVKDKKRREAEHAAGGKAEQTQSESARDKAGEMVREALAESPDNRYLHVKDAGVVSDAEGKAMSPEALAKKLPRLKSALLRLHMVRRDPIQPFTVFHFVVSDPVILLPGPGGYKEITLHNFKPPMPKS